jgi:mycothiol synthase
MNIRLPEGYYSRPVIMEDAEAIAELYNAQSRWLIGANELEAGELRRDWGSPFLHLETDSQVVFSPEDNLAGHVEMWDMRAPHVNLFAFVAVHPQYMQCGIGSFLAGWLKQRAQANLGKAPENARVVLHQSVQSSHQAAMALLTQQGYKHIRDSYQMVIDFAQPPAAPDIPRGIVIRSICGEEELRNGIYARYESFLDHWGAVNEPFDDFYKRWKYLIEQDPRYDPTLFFIALDGAEIAGISICDIMTDEDPDMGWVGSLGVRRAWRKRGLGLALLQHSFLELHRRGKARVGLGVDASNLTGATRLYERAGMHVQRIKHTFELELRDGVTLTRQTID